MFRRAFFAVCATVLLAACGDTTNPNSAIGSYTLVTANGDAPPILVSSTSTETVDLTAGTLVLRNNGTFTGTFSYRTTSGTGTTNSTDSFSGTWNENGSNVDLTVTGQGSVSATRSGNTLTIYDQGDIYVYQR